MESYQLLESRFGRFAGERHTVACASGSAALHLAFEALGLPPGSEVICPEYTMIACARAITLAGLTPVFVDVGEDLLIDPRKAASAVTPRTRAILAVHIYGRLCRAEPLNELSYKRQLLIVEDCSESHGAASGLDSMAKCWSFYRNKIIGGEEGGLVAFGCEEDAERARMLRSHGFTARHDFMHIPRGWNYRMANSLAAPILRSLDCYEDNLQDRRRIESLYNQLIPPTYWQPPRAAPWVYDVRLPRATFDLQDRIVSGLNQQGIAARHGFKPISMQPEYLRPYAHLTAYWRGREIMYLPICPTMTDDQVVRAATMFLREVDAAYSEKT